MYVWLLDQVYLLSLLVARSWSLLVAMSQLSQESAWTPTESHDAQIFLQCDVDQLKEDMKAAREDINKQAKIVAKAMLDQEVKQQGTWGCCQDLLHRIFEAEVEVKVTKASLAVERKMNSLRNEWYHQDRTDLLDMIRTVGGKANDGDDGNLVASSNSSSGSSKRRRLTTEILEKIEKQYAIDLEEFRKAKQEGRKHDWDCHSEDLMNAD